MLVLSNYGNETILKNVVGIERNYLWFLKLFVNNHHPSTTDTEALYREPSFIGYEKIMILNWRMERESQLLRVSAEEAVWKLREELEEELSVFGYFVTDLDDKLLFAERFSSAPFRIQRANSSIAVKPTLKM